MTTQAILSPSQPLRAWTMPSIDSAEESLYNRSMDEYDHALTLSDIEAMEKPCAFCHRLFIPDSEENQHCSQKCMVHAKTLYRPQTMGNRLCDWCNRELNSTNPKARFCSSKCRLAAFKASPCIYCGVQSDSRDHFIPRAFADRIRDFGVVRNIILPACMECNSTAGDHVFLTLKEKRAFIKECYLKKYRKLLESPDWSKNEIEELGPLLQPTIRSMQANKELLRKRLKKLSRGK